MKLSRGKKGQYLTVEYVLFFGIGIAMIVSVYFIFSAVNETTSKVGSDIQMEKVGELIRGTIIYDFEAARYTDSTIYHNISIPTSISGCVYEITATENLNLNCTDNNIIGAVLSLYGISASVPNRLVSTRGYVSIKATSGAVELL